MRLWKAEDERRLKDSLQQRLLVQPKLIQKQSHRAKKVDSLWWMRLKVLGSILFFGALMSGIVFFPAFGLIHDVQAPFCLSYVLFSFAWFCSLFLRPLFLQGPELYLSALLPIPFATVLQGPMGRLRLWLGGIGFTVWVYLSIWDSLFASPSAGPIFVLLHTLAFVVTCLLLLKIPGSIPAFCLALGAVALGLLRIYGVSNGLDLASFLDTLAILLPNGWILHAERALREGGWLECGLSIFLLIPAWLLGLSWISDQKGLLQQVMEAEGNGEPEGEMDGETFDESQPLGRKPVPAGKVANLLRRCLDPEVRPYVDFFSTPLTGSDANWRWRIGIAGGAFLLNFYPHSYVAIASMIVLVVLALLNVPLCGGAWLGEREKFRMYQPVPFWAIYPVDFKKLTRGIWKVNSLRCGLAFPFWILAGLSVGKLIGDRVQGITVVGCLWVGLLAAVGLSFFVRTESTFLWIWIADVVAGVFGWGWVLRVWLVREATGLTCDFMAVRR